MRSKIVQVVMSLLTSAATVALMGCATAPKGDKVRIEVAGWAEDFGALALIAKPEYRPALEAAVRSLDSAEQSGGINLSAITAALTQVDGLQSKDSKLAIIGGRLVLRRVLGNATLETPELLNSAGLGLRDGLRAALGVPTSNIERPTSNAELSRQANRLKAELQTQRGTRKDFATDSPGRNYAGRDAFEAPALSAARVY